MPKETFHNLAPQKKERLVNAAIHEFAHRGYVSASLDDIARTAKVSKGSLYQYFGGKLEMYEWLLGDELPRRKQAALSSLAPEGSFFDLLENSFHAGLQFFISEPELATLGATLLRPPSVPELSALHQRSLENAHKGLLALVREAQRKGEVTRKFDVDLITLIVTKVMTESLFDVIALKSQRADTPSANAQALSKRKLKALVKESTEIVRRALSAKE